MLLTTVGAHSGKERTSPVMYHRDGERHVVVASKGGAPDNPDWYNNLKANPVARVEVGTATGTETFEVRAREAEGEERERMYADRVAIAPGFGEYQRKTSRLIPVMILERTG
jgi:deazaflavin-dependent oxidoreductase (nitroreductase family)